jgi:hypothetical protein
MSYSYRRPASASAARVALAAVLVLGAEAREQADVVRDRGAGVAVRVAVVQVHRVVGGRRVGGDALECSVTRGGAAARALGRRRGGERHGRGHGVVPEDHRVLRLALERVSRGPPPDAGERDARKTPPGRGAGSSGRFA